MLTYNKDDFDGTLDDIMKSVNDILNKTGKGYETQNFENNCEIRLFLINFYVFIERNFSNYG